MKLCFYSLLFVIITPYLGKHAIAMELSRTEAREESSNFGQNDLNKTKKRMKRLAQEITQLVLEESPIVSQENSSNLQDILLLLQNLDNRNKRDRDEIDNFIFTLKGGNVLVDQDLLPEQDDTNEEVIILLQELMQLMRIESQLEQDRLNQLVQQEDSESSESADNDFDAFLEAAFSDSRDLDTFR